MMQEGYNDGPIRRWSKYSNLSLEYRGPDEEEEESAKDSVKDRRVLVKLGKAVYMPSPKSQDLVS